MTKQFIKHVIIYIVVVVTEELARIFCVLTFKISKELLKVGNRANIKPISNSVAINEYYSHFWKVTGLKTAKSLCKYVFIRANFMIVHFLTPSIFFISP